MTMKTLIVPCAGDEMIDGLPLILNSHPRDGVMLAEKLLTGIFPESWSRIVFAVTAETEQKYSVSKAVSGAVHRSDVIVLPSKTSGGAETVYETIIRAGITGEFAVKDSRNRITLTEPTTGNSVAGIDLTERDYAVENLRSKSFLVLNEQGEIKDIVEKHLRSDIISVGLYSFRSAEDYVSAFLRLSADDYQLSGLYISHVISYLIGRRDFIFHCSKITDFEDWSSPSAWQKLRHSSFCPAKSRIRLIMTDLDGTLFDTARVNYSAYQEALRPLGCELDYEHFRKFCNGRHYTDFLPEIMPDITEDEMTRVHSAKKVLYRKYVHLARLNLQLLSLLDMCRSECRLALVTTASRENTQDILTHSGLENYFDLVLTHENIERSKPDPEGYVKAMNFFGALPEECIIFEDSDSGIEAARRSGAQYFAVTMKEELDTTMNDAYNRTSHIAHRYNCP